MARTASATRLAALRRTCLLDEPTTPTLDRLAKLAARVIGTPVSLISLIDRDRQFFAGHAGLPEPLVADPQTPFSHSICRYVVDDGAPLVIDDTSVDERVRDNGAVSDLGVAAYAGVPITAPDGEVLGSFCAIDYEPRTWTADDLATLHDIGAAVSAEIEGRALLRERDTALEEHASARRRLEVKQARLSALADIGELITTVDDHTELAEAVANRLVPAFADWCLVELEQRGPDGDETPRPPIAAIGASTPQQRADVIELRSIARSVPGWRSPTRRAAASARPVYHPRIELGEMIDSGDPDDVPARMRELLVDLRFDAVSAVPLVSRGRLVGAVSFVRSGVERDGFDENERSVHLEVARRLAMAVEAARLREALAARARAAQVIEQIDDGVVLLDDSERVALWNPAATRITGIDPATAIGARLADLLPALDAAVRDEVHAPDDAAVQVAIDTPHGRRWIAVLGDDVGPGAVLALRDITAEHRLEQARDEMVATVSHQLRTPVTSVLAAAMTLQRDDIAIDEATTSLLIDTIVQQGERLEELCDDVLLAYRLDHGGHTVAAEPVELRPLLQELCDALAGAAGPSIQLSVAVEPDATRAIGDEHALRQVFGNLVENAVKYSPEGGAIELTARRSATSPGDVVEVTVRDHGIGIPPDQHGAIFERFHRLDPDMARGVGGVGLGLFVVRELVALMHGAVRVESAGRGTDMIVALPAPSAG